MRRKRPLEKVYVELLARILKRGGSIHITQITNKAERTFLIKLRMNDFLTESNQTYTLTDKGKEAAEAYQPPPKDVPDIIP